jgi:hypothetical protein
MCIFFTKSSDSTTLQIILDFACRDNYFRIPYTDDDDYNSGSYVNDNIDRSSGTD